MSDSAEKIKLREEWRLFAEEWIRRCEEGRDDARVGLLDDWMLNLAGDVRGLQVADLGCGEGRFSRMLASRGAQVLGIDLQPAFVARANSLRGPSERYEVGDMESLSGIPDAHFDLAVSYISLVDVPDMKSAIHQSARVLKKSGRFIVCNLSPMATAAFNAPWLRDGQQRKLHYILDDYTREGPRLLSFGPRYILTNFHRPLSTTLNAFIQAGFRLVGLHEPTPNAEQLKRVPANEDLFRVPLFVIYDLIKSTE